MRSKLFSIDESSVETTSRNVSRRSSSPRNPNDVERSLRGTKRVIGWLMDVFYDAVFLSLKYLSLSAVLPALVSLVSAEWASVIHGFFRLPSDCLLFTSLRSGMLHALALVRSFPWQLKISRVGSETFREFSTCRPSRWYSVCISGSLPALEESSQLSIAVILPIVYIHLSFLGYKTSSRGAAENFCVIVTR